MEKITEEQYKKACEDQDKAKEIINQYHTEKREEFNQRLIDNPIFTDDELYYSRFDLCPCGHGLAYPKNCGVHHYWDCSAILKGIADKTVMHTDQLPFAFYDIKGERGEQTTRGVFLPRKKE